MIDLHYWTTPNGHKITIFLEETGIPYPPTPAALLTDDERRLLYGQDAKTVRG
jgi:GST-like protein